MNGVARKRYGFIALLFGLFAPGLGFLYSGKVRLAILTLFFVPTAIVALFAWTRLILIPSMYFVCVLLIGIAYSTTWIASFIIARRNSPCVLNRSQRWYWYVLFVAAAYCLNLALLASRGPLFGYEPFRIPSVAMRPTLEPGDYLITDRWAYSFHSPKRGEVVVFRYPPDQNRNYVKRVLGMPGEQIVIEQGIVSVDGTPIEELYIDPSLNQHSAGADTIDVRVPSGYYFVLGDNRDNSSDSRHWGLVPQENMLGRAEYIWMSYSPGGVRFDRVGQIIE